MSGSPPVVSEYRPQPLDLGLGASCKLAPISHLSRVLVNNGGQPHHQLWPISWSWRRSKLAKENVTLLNPLADTPQLGSSLIAPYAAISGASSFGPGASQMHRPGNGLTSTGAVSIATKGLSDHALATSQSGAWTPYAAGAGNPVSLVSCM